MTWKAPTPSDMSIPRNHPSRDLNQLKSSTHLANVSVQFPTSAAWHPCCRVLLGGDATHILPTGNRCLPGPGPLTQALPTDPLISACWWASGHKHRQLALLLGLPERTDNASGKSQCRRQNFLHRTLANMQKQKRFKRSLFLSVPNSISQFKIHQVSQTQ